IAWRTNERAPTASRLCPWLDKYDGCSQFGPTPLDSKIAERHFLLAREVWGSRVLPRGLSGASPAERCAAALSTMLSPARQIVIGVDRIELVAYPRELLLRDQPFEDGTEHELREVETFSPGPPIVNAVAQSVGHRRHRHQTEHRYAH